MANRVLASRLRDSARLTDGLQEATTLLSRSIMPDNRADSGMYDGVFSRLCLLAILDKNLSYLKQ